MGARLSQKQIYGRVYRRLQRLNYLLWKVGVDAGYESLSLAARTDRATFKAWYNVLRASNGEVAGLLQVRMTLDGRDIPVSQYANFEDIVKKAEEVFILSQVAYA